MRLSWSSAAAADLSGYRLRYGTTPGYVDTEVDAGKVTSLDVPGLALGVTYYFSVTAYDSSGNESLPSQEVQARLAPDRSAPPVIESAMEMSSHSIYAVRVETRMILVRGLNFESGASVDLGPGITATSPVLTPTGDLIVQVNVPASAATGPRAVTVRNPDLGIGTSTGMITIVKSPDADHDCAVGALDLNILARAWNEAWGESRYAPTVDLDGDDYIGPEDLTVFVNYFGREFTGCP